MSITIGLTFEKPKKEKEPKTTDKTKTEKEATEKANGEDGGK